MTTILWSVEELADAMLSDRPPVVLDVRWQLGDDRGRERYREGHIPGAIYVDLDAELTSPPSALEGRHPLPDPMDLQAAARSWGVDDDSRVVVYDDIGNLAAARAWWLLRWAGLGEVVMLDGGLTAWAAAGFRESSGNATPRPGTATLGSGRLPTVSIDEVAVGSGVIVDARVPERFRGETEPIDPRAGHIPGAINAPTVDNLSADGRFRSAEELRERFAALGIGPEVDVTVYCGSGVNAAHEIAAMEIAGLPGARLYPGSWSQWSADPERPAETG